MIISDGCPGMGIEYTFLFRLLISKPNVIRCGEVRLSDVPARAH